VQQHLVALAVNLQHAAGLADTDPAAAKALLEEMGRDVQQALDDTARLAQRIYPPLLEAGGLGAALRAAIVDAGLPAKLEVTASADYRPEAALAVYFSCLEILGQAPASPASVTVRDDGDALVFEVVVAGPSTDLTHVRDRVQALGGELTIASEPDGDTRVTGSVPLPR
jgi:signal transduction histidine kinase